MDSPLSTLLYVKIIPNASRSVIVGWMENLLKIKVTAQPEKGKANKEVEALLVKEPLIKSIKFYELSSRSILGAT